MTIPIPARKPNLSQVNENGNAAGFLNSFLDGVKSLGNTAFDLSAQYARAKQLFDNPENVNGEGVEAQNVTAFTSPISTPVGNVSTTMLIGGGLAVLALVLIMKD